MSNKALVFKEVDSTKLNGGHGWYEAAGVATGLAVGAGFIVLT